MTPKSSLSLLSKTLATGEAVGKSMCSTSKLWGLPCSTGSVQEEGTRITVGHKMEAILLPLQDWGDAGAEVPSEGTAEQQGPILFCTALVGQVEAPTFALNGGCKRGQVFMSDGFCHIRGSLYVFYQVVLKLGSKHRHDPGIRFPFARG